ncbi:Uncharacterised protein [Mycobacteroides abscessus subsp. bolletii]|uniref:hypothetical protein n=1 Tax=Mycobacteroides abscessus TaxID=36809 RepID=UPI0009A8F43A|nr:hypothetical protein [Mycobacteroides abscessus]SKY24269.1 Uncharacterised protein [Mycobacteroides abscessus subsp. bolletii]
MTTAEQVHQDAVGGPRVTVVTVSGDRQHGKTHILLDLVAGELRRGRLVLYETSDWPVAQERHRNLVNAHLMPGIDNLERVCRSANDLSIRHRSGGRVQFLSIGRSRSGAHYRADTYVFDDVPVPRELLYGPPARIYHAPRADDRPFW